MLNFNSMLLLFVVWKDWIQKNAKYRINYLDLYLSLKYIWVKKKTYFVYFAKHRLVLTVPERLSIFQPQRIFLIVWLMTHDSWLMLIIYIVVCLNNCVKLSLTQYLWPTLHCYLCCYFKYCIMINIKEISNFTVDWRDNVDEESVKFIARFP